MNETLDTEQARVCAWCFNLQLRSEQKDISDYLRNILHHAQITNRIRLHMVSFSWSPDENGPLVEIFGFLHAHKQVRKGTLKTWLQDDRISNIVKC